jgi:hypothetical protein
MGTFFCGMNSTIFLDVTSCSLVEVHQYFEQTYGRHPIHTVFCLDNGNWADFTFTALCFRKFRVKQACFSA